jgi:cytochrome P450
MTATGLERAERESAASANGASAPGLPPASLPESMRIVRTALLPAIARGLFSPRRRAMRALTKLDADGRAVRTLSAIRDKRGGAGVRILGGKMVVIWEPAAIRSVLDQSADLYAGDAGAKAKGMSHFQPDALTLSRGADWRDRRAFTEAVLASRERVHPFAKRFVDVVADEVARVDVGQSLAWEQWEQLFDRLTLRVIFGDGSRDDQTLTELLETLLGQANRLVGTGPNDDYYELYGRLERKLLDPEPGSLLSRFADAPQTARTRIVQQLPHWMFAMRDTLGANTYRALAAIVADPGAERRVREEIDGADLRDPAAIDDLSYLEGCLHETMRAWPTTPLIARELTRDATLAGERLEKGTQVLILNTFNHRDREQVPDVDRFVPERWRNRERDYRFNHLSNGTQDCPGGPLVLLLGKAALAHSLGRWRLRLDGEPLQAGEALPSMLDFFRIRFAVEPGQ